MIFEPGRGEMGVLVFFADNLSVFEPFFNVAKQQAPFTEPTPNRGQRVLAPFAEVRRRKTKGQRGFGG
jgi:hypothetical protein